MSGRVLCITCLAVLAGVWTADNAWGEDEPPAGGVVAEERTISRTPPELRRRVVPDYPKRASRAGVGGAVKLECVLTTGGEVRECKALQGHWLLVEASTRAVAKWRYEPAREDGKAIDCTLTLDLNFMLPEVPRVKDLVSSLEDEDEVIREVACEWLGRLRPGTKAQHAALERTAQEDSSEQVRAAAARALRKLDECAKGRKGR